MSIEKIMEQAQVFASAWSVVGGPFDGGDAVEVATQEKDELRCMVGALAAERDALAAELSEMKHMTGVALMCNHAARMERAEPKLSKLGGQEPVARVCDWQAPEGLLKGWVETNYDEASECANKVRHRD